MSQYNQYHAEIFFYCISYKNQRSNTLQFTVNPNITDTKVKILTQKNQQSVKNIPCNKQLNMKKPEVTIEQVENIKQLHKQAFLPSNSVSEIVCPK